MSEDIGLVYIRNNKNYRMDITGYTLLGHIVNRYQVGDKIKYDVQITTDPSGKSVSDAATFSIDAYDYLENRPKVKLTKNFVYHLSPGDLSANNYVFQDNHERPLENTTFKGWPSGIQGLYLPRDDVVNYLTETLDEYIKINFENSLVIQDQAHAESLSAASRASNVILDDILGLLEVNGKWKTPEIIQQLVSDRGLSGVVTLWNIVFFRLYDTLVVDSEWLSELMVDYLLDFDSPDHQDYISERPLKTPFINKVLETLKYDSVINYNNDWLTQSTIFDVSKVNRFHGANQKH